jgi:hypothetical protein
LDSELPFSSIWTIVVLSGYFSASRNSVRINSKSSSVVMITWKVSLVACRLGGDYVARLLPELRKKRVSNTKVSVRLAGISVLSGGRKMILEFFLEFHVH